MELNDPEVLCYEYINLVKDIEYVTSECGLFQTLYSLDNLRSQMHDKICNKMNLTKE